MTSELRVDNLKGSTTGGSINVLGEGTSATTNLQQGLCKAWSQFDGTDSGAAARDSFNVSSMTDNSTGNHTVTYNNDFASTNTLTASGNGGQFSGATANNVFIFHKTIATGSIIVQVQIASSGSNKDQTYICHLAHGDLA
jgi:hypothetical protein